MYWNSKKPYGKETTNIGILKYWSDDDREKLDKFQPRWWMRLQFIPAPQKRKRAGTHSIKKCSFFMIKLSDCPQCYLKIHVSQELERRSTQLFYIWDQSSVRNLWRAFPSNFNTLQLKSVVWASIELQCLECLQICVEKGTEMSQTLEFFSKSLARLILVQKRQGPPPRL